MAQLVAALCHFCEAHGPTVLTYTKTFGWNNDPSEVRGMIFFLH